LGLLLSNKPTVLPLRSAKRGSAAIRSDDVRAFPSGLKIIIVSPCSVRGNSVDLILTGSFVVEIDSYWDFPSLFVIEFMDNEKSIGFCRRAVPNWNNRQAHRMLRYRFIYRNQKKLSTGAINAAPARSDAKISVCALPA
jgi:hypothetical protein